MRVCFSDLFRGHRVGSVRQFDSVVEELTLKAMYFHVCLPFVSMFKNRAVGRSETAWSGVEVTDDEAMQTVE